jgi:hypothetical protein
VEADEGAACYVCGRVMCWVAGEAGELAAVALALEMPIFRIRIVAAVSGNDAASSVSAADTEDLVAVLPAARRQT